MSEPSTHLRERTECFTMQAITTELNMSTTNNFTGYEANLSIGGILFCLVLTPLASLFGLITNGITVVLLLTTKPWDTTSILLFSLTVADFFSLVINFSGGVINIITFASYQRSADKTFNELFFKNIFIYTGYISLTLSKPINALISIQRCSAVVRPLTFKKFWTKKNTVTSVLAFTIPVIVLGICSGLLLESTDRVNFNELEGVYYVTNYDGTAEEIVTLDIIFSSLKAVWFIVPVIATFFVNCATFWGLKRNRNRIGNLDTAHMRRHVMEMELTKHLFLVTTIFVVTNIPMLVSTILSDRYDQLHIIDNGDEEVIGLVVDASIFLVMVNMSVNCIVFVLRNSRYRSKFTTMISCGSHEAH